MNASANVCRQASNPRAARPNVLVPPPRRHARERRGDPAKNKDGGSWTRDGSANWPRFACTTPNSPRASAHALPPLLGEELYFLRHAAPDDLVVLVEAELQRFAIEDFFADPILDQDAAFVRRRFAPPLRPEHQNELAKCRLL